MSYPDKNRNLPLECLLFQYQSLHLMSKAAASPINDSIRSQQYEITTPPMRTSNSQSRQMRIKTLPNEAIMEDLNNERDAHTFHIAARETRLSNHKSALSMEKNSNEIEYFELDLKDIIDKANPQKTKLIQKPQNDNSKQTLTKILNDFMMKLEYAEENQIQQTFLSSLSSHLENIDNQSNKLTALMDYSINELSGKLKENSQSTGSKLCKQKRLKDFFNYKYNKNSHKTPVSSKENAGSSQTPSKFQGSEGYHVKKMTKTIVDQQGNQFRVTVQRLN